MTVVSRGFLQFLQANADVVPQLTHSRSFQTYFQFIVHTSSIRRYMVCNTESVVN
jgi:hypothetical protein